MKVVIAGATGLVGGKILEILLQEPKVEKVYALSRRTQNISDPKLEWIIGPLPPEKIPQAEALILAIGTTMAKAGSQDSFKKTDVEIPYKIAQLAKMDGYQQVLSVSAKGASQKSFLFYNRAKADLENRLINLAFEKTVFVRPGLLLGERKENRPGEKISQFLFRNLNFMLPKSLKAVKAEAVAMALIAGLLSAQNGVQIIENHKIVEGS